MGHRFLASCLSLLIFAAPAAAADTALPLSAAATAAAADVAASADRTEAAAPETVAPGMPASAAAWTPTSRPLVLPALYAGSAALQAFDAYSTMKALRLGASEANPL